MNAHTRDLPRAGLSRRQFITTASLTAGGALVVGCSPAQVMSIGAAQTDFGPFGPFIRIDPDSTVTVVSKHIEFGQGSHTGLAAMVAEELDADWSCVRVEQAPANAKVYGNLGMGVQGTGGSSAIANSWMQLRTAGAAARAMFVEAAARRWNVPASQITVANCVVSHPSGKQARFGELAADAAKVAPPARPMLKSSKDFTLIGTERVRRKDAGLKSTGKARFTQDVHLPDQLTAMVAHPPQFGGKVRGFDASAAKATPGVVDVFEIPSGVAVVATSTWAAKKGREALKVDWDNSKAETRSSAAIMTAYHDLAAGRAQPANGFKWTAFEAKGSTSPAGGKVVEAAFDFPFLAHAPMEPMNCVAQVGKGPPKLTFGSQIPTVDQLNTAMIVGTLPGSVQIETLYAGGSFGRRANFKSDYVSECVHIAKHVGGGRPVKLVWTREDDMTGGYYRPMAHHTVRVELGPDGLPRSWRQRIVTQSLMKGSPMGGSASADPSATEGVKGSPYLDATPNVDGQVVLYDTAIPVLWWRSVGATHTAFVMEHTVDQLARAAGQDPVAYRRALYKKAGADDHLAALDLAVEKAGPTPTPGWTRGVAVHESFGSVVAQVVEVKLVNGVPRVGRVVTGIHCGTAVSPDQIAAQMEGGTCFGLSAALYGQITMTNGVVDQKNFDTYRVLRMNEAPTVETYIVPSTEKPTGVGEPGTPVIAPAVANALLAITGKPTSKLPFVQPT
ncbi:MAG TPA: xanthine dehydrogenase family protein molybdopterin-binding subunit [Caulobacteraceae bacterium]|jgi:isoquinoline 1-oxidoreductase beta subunit